jgi:histidinol-phosphatase (PHP family)
MRGPGQPWRVSIHGGHSGEFCNHARDSLQDVVEAYIRCGFAWVGITEHIPPLADRFLYPDEIAQGLDSRALYRRFGRYMAAGRAVQKKYAPHIRVFIAFETETYSGSAAFVRQLRTDFAPDYIVGSVHHVADVGFDYSPAFYADAVRAAGGLDALYRRYFDTQHEMIADLRPEVVGHFDLIRIYDPDHAQRLRTPEIRNRIERNLQLIRSLDLILDFNVRALQKGGVEPYPTRWIVQAAVEMGIALVPGDDSHGVDTVGRHIDTAIQQLEEQGADTNWRAPVGAKAR